MCLLVPARFTRAPVRLREVRWHLIYFGAIGLGFMLIEMSLMQRMILLLGHPTYGLSVVLFALLLGSGAGSFLTRHVTDQSVLKVAPLRLLMLLAALVVLAILTPWAVRGLESSSIVVRASVAAIMLFGAGLLMGQAFPLGMRLASGREDLTLWLWAMNGAMSVCASVLGVVIALSFSISAAFSTGILAYALALNAASRIRAARA